MTDDEVRQLLGLLTEDELGRALGVVGATVAAWRGKGEGPPFYRFKRQIFYRTADVTQWLIEHTYDPVSGELLLSPGERLVAAPPTGGAGHAAKPPAAPKETPMRSDGTLELSAADITPAGAADNQILSAAERLKGFRSMRQQEEHDAAAAASGSAGTRSGG